MTNRAQVFHQPTKYPRLAKYAGRPWAVLVVWPDTHRYFEYSTHTDALQAAILITEGGNE